jgi:hypothetical protein
MLTGEIVRPVRIAGSTDSDAVFVTPEKVPVIVTAFVEPTADVVTVKPAVV